jgi:hypothetical protein
MRGMKRKGLWAFIGATLFAITAFACGDPGFIEIGTVGSPLLVIAVVIVGLWIGYLLKW